MTADKSKSLLASLEGRRMFAVNFVVDYVQLQFHPDYVLSALTLPIVGKDGARWSSDQPGYRDALVDQIGKIVTSTSETKEELKVVLDGNVEIVIRLDVKGLPGSERAMLDGGRRPLNVWQSSFA
ncbi:MAG TPA: hypothetical protein VNH83_22815 [Bryobacteraceae bacterium]|nr:hypothetical protein [Bryobacteraceae bacterium]